MEKFPTQNSNPEDAPKKEEAIAILKEFGFDNEKTKEVFKKLIEEKDSEIERIVDEKEHIIACFNRDIEIAEIYYEAGLLEAALEELTQVGEAAWDRNETEICNKINKLIDEIETKLK